MASAAALAPEIDDRTNQVPARAPIEVETLKDFENLRAHWTSLPQVPKIVAKREDAPKTAFPGQETYLLLSGEETAGAVNVFDNTAFTGFEGSDHYQPNEDEYWFILEGEQQVKVGTETVVARGGSFAFMPRHCTHAFKLLKDTHVITVNGPAGHDRAFQTLESMFADGLEDPMAPVGMFKNHDMVIYLDNPERPAVDELVNTSPQSFAAATDQELRAAWAASPAIPKLITSRDQARDVSVPGLDARLLLGADESSGRISAFDLFVEPGYEETTRQLDGEDQWWYVIDGELDVLIGKHRQTLSAGGFAYAPRGTTHALKNNSTNKVHMIRVHTPGGFERQLGKRQGR